MTKQLLTGIDTLAYSLEILWKDSSFFDYLTELKTIAKEKKAEVPGIIKGSGKDDFWKFLIKPFGADGYEWIIYGHEYNIKIGNWEKPSSRPSVFVYIRSETLWSNGVIESVEKINKLFELNGARILKENVSRADLCMDLLLDEDLIDIYLRDHITKKSRKWALYLGKNNEVQTIQVGIKSDVQCTIYNKAIEIAERKKKQWFYDLWKLKEVPSGKKIFRVEFKLRRPPLKEMGYGSLNDFLSNVEHVWAYCTQKWLWFDVDKKVDYRYRKIMPWWKVVQDYYLGIQKSESAIREKSINADIDQLNAMIVGCSSSVTALMLDQYNFEHHETIGFEGCIGAALDAYVRNGFNENDFKKLVLLKRVKYLRSVQAKRDKLK